jgi:virginiamycin B lyase
MRFFAGNPVVQPWRRLALLGWAPFALLCLSPRPTQGQDPQIREWTVPWEESRPRDPYVGPSGTVWFVGQRSHYVASFDPSSEAFRRYDLDDRVGPHNLIVGQDGTVWYAGNLANHIGKLDPASGQIRKIMMPDPEARDPHTLVFDGEGDIWFTVQAGNFVGHLDTDTEAVRLVEMPQTTMSGGPTSSRPYGIKLDRRGHPWVALFNTNKIATIDPASMTVRTFPLPEGARPRRLEIARDQRIWYVDFARGKLARLDPGTGEVEELDTPGGPLSRPYGMAMDGNGRIWFVETGATPNTFVGFDPSTETFFSQTPIPSGGGTVRHMYYDPSTDSIWFGTDVNTIGQASLPG